MVKVDVFSKMGDEEDGGYYVYNADTRDVKLPVSALIIPPAGDESQPHQFLPFQQRTTMKTVQGSIELGNFLVLCHLLNYNNRSRRYGWSADAC